jgi:ATP-dependent helicase HrpA
VAEIDPLWIEELAGDLARRSYSEPYYDTRNGFVRAREKVEVYGLPVVEGRRVHYGAIEPEESRRIFIRQALVEENLKATPVFFRQNAALRRAVAEISHKARQALLAGEEMIYDFYQQALPAGVHNDRALLEFIRLQGDQGLYLTREFLLENPPDGITPDRFPPELCLDGRDYPLRYRFYPGHPEDGVTLTVPVADLPNLVAWRLEWLVPGLLGAKVAALLRSLPKTLRRPLSPVAETAEQLLPRLTATEPLLDALTQAVRKEYGLVIPPSAWKSGELAEFLFMNVRAVDSLGQTLGMGRDLGGLLESLTLAARTAFVNLDKSRYELSGLTTWNFADLPERVAVQDGGGAAAFPALVDEGGSVGIRLFHTPAEAARAAPAGYRRIIRLTLADSLAKLEKAARLPAGAAQVAKRLGGGAGEALFRAALDDAFEVEAPPTSQRVFFERLRQGKEKLKPLLATLGTALGDALTGAGVLLGDLAFPPTPAHQEVYRDLSRQIESLFSPGVLALVNARQLLDLPRFVQAALKRRERLSYALGKDKLRLAEFLPLRERYEVAAVGRLAPEAAQALLRYRWLLEEYRIGFFVQEPGVKSPVGQKRLEESWREFLALR